MRRNPPARWALPDTVDPAIRRCIQIDVPDDPAHIAAFRGAMLALASAYNWSDDPTHKAKDVALVWREIIDSHLEWGCGLAIEFLQDECGLSFREVGAEAWTPIYDGLECLSSDGARSLIDGYIGDYIDQLIDDGVLSRGVVSQPPQPAPTPGSCTTYHVRLAPGASWLCPNPVSGTDIIQITNATGGWSIGELAWYCPDGARYLLGTCSETLHTHVSGDLLASAYHMQLIGLVNSVYFDCLTSSYTVPSGTPQGELRVMANTGLSGTPSGEVAFDVTVCAEAGAWCWDATPATDLIDTDIYYHFYGNAHTIPEGWQYDAAGAYVIAGGVARSFPNRTVASIRLKMDFMVTRSDGNSFALQTLRSGSIIDNIHQNPTVGPYDQTFNINHDIDTIYVYCVGDVSYGTSILKEIIYVGASGTNPMGDNNC